MSQSGRPSGECFVSLKNNFHLQISLSKHKNMMNERFYTNNNQ